MSMLSGPREKPFLSLFRSRLGIELICSHLFATLGSLILLTVVMLFATRDYFISTQQQQIAQQASYAAENYENNYLSRGRDWNNVPGSQGYDISLQIIINTSLQVTQEQTPIYLTLLKQNVH